MTQARKPTNTLADHQHMYEAVSSKNTRENALPKSEQSNLPITVQSADDTLNHLLMLNNFIYSDAKENYLVRHIKNIENTAALDDNDLRIDALRTFRGLLHIANDPAYSQDHTMETELFNIYNEFVVQTVNKINNKDLKNLEEKFSNILVKYLNLETNEDAFIQMSIAKDLGKLLEKQYNVCTITEERQDNSESVTIEKANFIKTNPEAYSLIAKKRNDQYQFTPSIYLSELYKFAGFKNNVNWIERFFMKYMDEIVKNGAPIPSYISSLLPIMTPTRANIVERVKLAKKDDQLTTIISQTTFVRTDLVDTSVITSDNNRKYLTEESLKTIINTELERGIAQFKKLYSGHIESNEPYFATVQTLLNPRKFGQLKNANAIQAKLVNDAILKIPLLEGYNRKSETNIVYKHTNIAMDKMKTWRNLRINALRAIIPTRWYTFKDSRDNVIRREKIVNTVAILQNILKINLDLNKIKQSNVDKITSWLRQGKYVESAREASLIDSNKIKDISAELQEELATRLQAAYSLNRLLNKEDPYNKLNTYQRNIMAGALELHVMGKQGLSIAGAKKTGDRTAVFAAAVDAMQDDPRAMYDWKILKSGMDKSLNLGHHVRSMLFHSAYKKVRANFISLKKRLKKISNTQPISQQKLSNSEILPVENISQKTEELMQNISSITNSEEVRQHWGKLLIQQNKIYQELFAYYKNLPKYNYGTDADTSTDNIKNIRQVALTDLLNRMSEIFNTQDKDVLNSIVQKDYNRKDNQFAKITRTFPNYLNEEQIKALNDLLQQGIDSPFLSIHHDFSTNFEELTTSQEILNRLKSALNDTLRYQGNFQAHLQPKKFTANSDKLLTDKLLTKPEVQQVYDAAKKNTPVDKSNDSFVITSNLDITSALEQLHEKIKDLQKETLHTQQINGQTWLVKYQDRDIKESQNAIHDNEVKIQGLRYLQGMLHIVNSLSIETPDEIDLKNNLYNKIQAAYADYSKKLNEKDPEKDVANLAKEFAVILKDTLDLKSENDGHKQVTMARDMAILLEKHPSVCTITNAAGSRVIVEQSSTVKVSNAYYKEYFPDEIEKQAWLKNALEFAGLDPEDTNSWIVNFFKNNLQELIKLGVPAPSSARWLPLPANNQVVETQVYRKGEKDQLTLLTQTHFIRMGSVSAYNIQPPKLQERLAVAQLKEIINTHLQSRINNAKRLYGNFLAPNDVFMVSYESLLSPIKLEHKLNHTDNNARFVNMAKRAMEELANDPDYKLPIQGLQLRFAQTNASVNKLSSTFTKEIKVAGVSIKIPIKLKRIVRKYAEDRETRREKINLTLDMAEKILGIRPEFDGKNSLLELATRLEGGFKRDNPEITDELRREMALRLRAAFYLNEALEKKPPTFDSKHVDGYQRNIMIAALEMLTMGSQTLTLAGCKSARDRTAIFAAAAKTMQENPDAMRSWKVLNAGIIQSLKEGHHFRAMLYHSAIVKVDAVHKDFVDALVTLKDKIKRWKIFSKRFEEKKESALNKKNIPLIGVVFSIKELVENRAKKPAAQLTQSQYQQEKTIHQTTESSPNSNVVSDTIKMQTQPAPNIAIPRDVFIESEQSKINQEKRAIALLDTIVIQFEKFKKIMSLVPEKLTSKEKLINSNQKNSPKVR